MHTNDNGNTIELDDDKLFEISCRVWIRASSAKQAEDELHAVLGDVCKSAECPWLAVESSKVREVTGE